MDRAHVTRLVCEHARMQVLAGPFKGMILSRDVCWGDGDLAPKLLGTYEEELHSYLRNFVSDDYDAIIDIGSAEGYYAVGLARASNAIVYAFDSHGPAREILASNAAINGVSDRIKIGAFCGPSDIVEIAKAHRKVFALIDCEGYEAEVLNDPSTRDALRTANMIVECHDFMDPTITGRIVGLLTPTHKIQIVYAAGRNPNVFPFLSGLLDNDRWAAISENRPCLMHWLICETRAI